MTRRVDSFGRRAFLAGGLAGFVVATAVRRRPAFIMVEERHGQAFHVRASNVRWFSVGDDDGCVRLCTSPDGCALDPRVRDKWVACGPDAHRAVRALSGEDLLHDRAATE
jgi:hypothetical protein